MCFCFLLELQDYAKNMIHVVDTFHRFSKRKSPIFLFSLPTLLLIFSGPINTFATSDYALPKFLVPQNYFLRLRPILEQNLNTNESQVRAEVESAEVWSINTAPGFVRISVFCINSTKTVILHSKNVYINESSVQIKRVLSVRHNELIPSNSSDVDFEVMSVSYDDSKDFAIFNVTRELEAGYNYEISMEFVARMHQNDSISGFYTIQYQLPWFPASETRTMAVTRFEPVGARQAFPCMDEPIYKTTFDLMVARRENFTSLSNAPLLHTEPDLEYPGWFWDRFGTTVKLPTYLVAVAVVSEYGFSEASSDLYRLPVRVYGPTEWIQVGHAQLAANYSARILSHYENKFGIPFSMPKLDSLLVPGERSALECHGLILYGDRMLIMQEDGSSDLVDIRFNWNVLSHEIAHAWFGNAVGNSWAEVWLKEGISTYVSYDGMSAVWPEMQGMQHMIYEVITTSLEYDVSHQTHPLKQEAYTKLKIKQNMDILGYDKGAALVRMMVGILGDSDFYRGIRNYLADFNERVATQNDLFEHLNAVIDEDGLIGVNLSEIMTPWTTQSGFPVVRVGWQNSMLLMSQEPWKTEAARETSLNGSNTDSLWDVPVRYAVITGLGEVAEETLLWLRRNESDLKIDLESIHEDSDWVVLVNSDGAGYYRVLYDNETAARIVNQLERNHSVFSAEARARLLDDQLNLAFQKYIPIQVALEYTKYMTQERDPTVWNCVLHMILKIFTLFRPTINGLQTRDDFISLKENLQLKICELICDGSCVYNNSDCDQMPVNETYDTASRTSGNDVMTIVQIIDQEIALLRKSNGLNESIFNLFRAYVLPRINATLLDITALDEFQLHPPGSKNFSLSAVGLLESVLIDWSCSLNSDWCFHYSQSLVAQWMSGGKREASPEEFIVTNPVPSHTQAMLYCQMVDWFGDFAYDWIYSQYQATNDTAQELWLSCALSCSKENNSFSEVISMLTERHSSESGQHRTIKKQYTSSIFSKLLQHSEYGTIFMGLLISLVPVSDYSSYFNFEKRSSEISGLFEYPKNYLWTEAHLQMVEDIVASNPEFYGDALNSIIETIQNNMRWMEDFRENITLWLQTASTNM